MRKSYSFVTNFAGFIVGIRLLNHYLLEQNQRLEPKRSKQIVFWLSFRDFVCAIFYLYSIISKLTFLVFGAVLVGLHFYQQKPRTFHSGGLWALAALIKANPLFMIILPVIQKRWLVLFTVIGLFSVGLILPDLLRPATNTQLGDAVTVPRVIIERDGRDNSWQYALNELQPSKTPYLSEFLKLTLDSDGPKMVAR